MTASFKPSDIPAGAFHVIPLGVGNAFTRRFFNTSFLLLAGGRAVAVDCPAPYGRVLGDAERRSGLSVDIGDIGHIVLTHLHGDHCNGLEEVGYYKRYVLGGERTNLYLLPELVEPLWRNRLSAVMEVGSDLETGERVSRSLEDYFAIHEWDEGREFALAGEPAIRFTIRRTLHSVPCFGFLATWNGVTLGYSADTPFEREHVDFLAPADLIIHETGEEGGHSSLESLRELPEEIRSKILLVHAPDPFHDNGDLGFPLAREAAFYRVGAGRDPVERPY